MNDLSRAFRDLAVFQVHIDIAAGNSRQLLGNYSCRTQQHGPRRIANRFLRNLLHAVRDQRDVHIRNVLIRQSLGKIEWAIKAEIQCLFE